jgi:DNA-binding transcriptional regulator GbsR (MarR family)
MLKKIRENFENGIEKIRWFSSLFSERLKIEISVMRLLYESQQMEKKKDDLLRKIGERVRKLKEQGETHVLKDAAVVDALSEIDKMSREIDATVKKASEISKIT